MSRREGGNGSGPSPSLFERVRKANAPAPPEHSVPFRVVTTIAVLTGILACESVGELSLTVAVISTIAVTLGMTFSYATRNRPHQWLKVVLAIAVVVVFVWFVGQILRAAGTGQLVSIEVPLAGLFAWVQVIHAFDVPARRDLIFSLAAAAALVTVASAQALSEGFLVYVAALLLCAVLGLSFSWRSMTAGGSGLPVGVLAGCLALIVVLALGLVSVLPAPRASQNLTLPSSLTQYLSLPGNGGLVNGTGSHPTEPAQPGRPGGRIGVGGYVGFSGPLDIANRYSLGSQVIMRVRANKPGYFLGLTYDTWNGQSWYSSAHDQGVTRLSGGSPFEVPLPRLHSRHVKENVQTFYVEADLPNILFATSDPVEVYFPANSLVLGHDGSIRSTIAITPGTVYTVISADDEVSPKVLAADRAPLTPRVKTFPSIKSALQLPYGYPRVAALTRAIVSRAHAHTEVAKVTALEAWMSRNIEYTTDIPPLKAGQDAVSQFLFVTKRGYCEQISTALAVMLRTLGIPAREAIGYVPGPLDPLSDLYEIQAKDAHAWVQVYFPKYGWQSFDPTANVPLDPESPGSVFTHDILAQAARIPLVPIGSVMGAGLAGYGVLSYERRRRRWPRSWAGRATFRLERLGARAGCRRRPSETLTEYARRLEAALPGLSLSAPAARLERACYSFVVSDDYEPSTEDKSEVERALASLRRLSRRRLGSPSQRARSRA